MKMINQHLHFNINYKTAILESLDWDEELLAKLLTYLDQVFNEDIVTTSPEKIIYFVEENFGKPTASVLIKIFKQISIEYGLHMRGGEIEN